MKKQHVAFLLLFAVIGSVLIQRYYLKSVNPLPSCSEITKQQLQAKIILDLIEHRIPNGGKIFGADELGTSKPEISFSSSTLNSSADGKLISTPVEIIGPNKKIALFAIYECKDGHIEYSIKGN